MNYLEWLGIEDDDEDEERGAEELPPAIARYMDQVRSLNPRGDLSLSGASAVEEAIAAAQTVRHFLIVTRLHERQVKAERRALKLSIDL